MGSLEEYLNRPIEPSWLYLENRYVQYANALCAAAELSAVGKSPAAESVFATLPSSFVPFVENELNPVDVVPNDLYPLKQRAQSGPHREFYLRSATEQEFKVGDVRGTPLGKLSFSQALREAYPGAVHYYMARPYRVFGFNYRTGEIKVKRCRQWTTRPQAQSVVFPRFQGGVLNLLRSDDGMVAEVELQVSERVVGFVEQRGKVKSEHLYGPGSEYYQKPITRFFETTGICWWFPERFATSEAMADRLLEAFCVEFGIQKRDLGVGTFRTTSNPHAPAATAGICIYDATNGSLRLTQMLGANFAHVISRAIVIAEERSESLATLAELRALAGLVARLQHVGVHRGSELPLQDTEWATVVAPGQRAVYTSADGALEVTVIGHRYTPQGLMYELAPVKPGTRWLVIAADIRPINGQTTTVVFNLVTGELRDHSSAA
jgi:DEAD/DEAH box helicase domain-containing protein